MRWEQLGFDRCFVWIASDNTNKEVKIHDIVFVLTYRTIKDL